MTGKGYYHELVCGIWIVPPFFCLLSVIPLMSLTSIQGFLLLTFSKLVYKIVLAKKMNHSQPNSGTYQD